MGGGSVSVASHLLFQDLSSGLACDGMGAIVTQQLLFRHVSTWWGFF